MRLTEIESMVLRYCRCLLTSSDESCDEILRICGWWRVRVFDLEKRKCRGSGVMNDDVLRRQLVIQEDIESGSDLLGYDDGPSNWLQRRLLKLCVFIIP